MGWAIPFNKPYLAGNELHYVAEAIARGNASCDGDFTAACSRILEERFGIGRALMTTSCTSALEIAALLCGFEDGDEVILPSFTFVSTACAFARAGARPVFVDVRPDTLNLDEARVAEAMNDRTRAIVPVHYAGVGCEMGALRSLADEAGALIVEDAAQGVNATHQGRYLGAIGQLAAYSFHETKNYACGQGGALCINDPALVDRAEVLRERGTDRSRFMRGEVEQYTWVDLGSAYAQSELLCAYLLAQLEKLEDIAARRARIAGWYREQLAPLADRGLVTLPHDPAEDGAEPASRTNHHLFYLLLEDLETRGALERSLADRGIQAVRHYIPLHQSEAGRDLGRFGPLPVSEDVSARILRLPMFNELTESEVVQVARGVAEHFRVPAAA